MSDNTAKAKQLISQLREGGVANIGPLLSEQVVMELPFAPAGVPKSVSGRSAVLNALGFIDQHFERFRINVHEAYVTADHDTVILECTAVGIYRIAAPVYQNRYVIVFRFRDDVVVQWREFFNPYQVIQTGSSLATV